MKWDTREIQLTTKYDTPETVCLVTSYPARHGESAERNAIANYSRELVREMAKKTRIVVIAEILDRAEMYEEDGVLVVRAFRHDSILMNWQIVTLLKKFRQAKNVLLQFEFGVYGGSVTTFMLAFLGLLVRTFNKHESIMIHQVTDDLGELAEHLGIVPHSLKTFIYNFGMKTFYVIAGWGARKIFVHNNFLAKKISRYVSSSKVSIIPHGVGTASRHISRSKARAQLKWANREFVIIAFGYLSWYKGSDWVVETIGKLKVKYPNKNIKLILAGGESGTLKDMPHYRAYLTRLYSLVKKYNVEITGYVHDLDKEKYFVGADLVILPHRVAMSESGVMAHVAMYGKPFLASQSRTTSLTDPELIKSVEFDWNPCTLEKKLLHMINDQSNRSSVSRKIREQGKKYGWSNTADQYLQSLPTYPNGRYTGAKYVARVAV